jgi:vanillate O-demethylase monooxygenase subunit
VAAARNYPLNCWYVAARSGEVTDGDLTAVRVADTPIVLVRGGDGSVAALEDRSPHRPYPLSRGRLADGRIVSGFDGWQFDLTGACLQVPSQSHLPLDASVRSFPTEDDGTFVFVWPGNSAIAALRPPPRSQWDNPQWTAAGGRVDVDANYLLLHEIFADVTHIPFVHPDVAPTVLGDVPPPPLEVEVTETAVSFSRAYPPGPLASWHSQAVGLPADGSYEQREHGSFVNAGLWVDRWEALHDGAAHVLGFTQAITPVGVDRTRLHWWISRQANPDDSAITRALQAQFNEYYRRVAEVAETMQAVIDADGPRRDVNVSADAAALQVRRIVNALVREESGRAAPGRRRTRRTANL